MMMRLKLFSATMLASVVLVVVSSGCRPADQEITFATSDGITISGDIYHTSADKSAPLIFLFHQGASNARAEYGSIVPKLTSAGFHVVAIDQRRGGDRLGGYNRTVSQLDSTSAAGAIEYEYCDVYPDLEAALDYTIAEGYSGKRLLWGSSYSASLAIQLAAKRSDVVDGVLAFSPSSGGPLTDCRPALYLSELSAPLLVLRPGKEMEIESVRDQFQMFEDAGYRTHVAGNGVHGSSMLNPERVEGPVEETWNVVLDFLREI